MFWAKASRRITFRLLGRSSQVVGRYQSILCSHQQRWVATVHISLFSATEARLSPSSKDLPLPPRLQISRSARAKAAGYQNRISSWISGLLHQAPLLPGKFASVMKVDQCCKYRRANRPMDFSGLRTPMLFTSLKTFRSINAHMPPFFSLPTLRSLILLIRLSLIHGL